MNEQMTDFQFTKILQMVLKILKGSDDLQDATKQIEELLQKEQN